MSWAKRDYKDIDSGLHKTGIYLLDKLFEAHKKEKPSSYESIEIKKQYKSIDVLALINDEFAIIIEDKTNTSDNFDKLKKYVDEITKRNFNSESVLPIYFKTGDQGSYIEIEKAGYARFSRKDFLTVLEYGTNLGVTNSTFLDYYNYLLNIENYVNSFRTLPFNDWNKEPFWGRPWHGFFKELQKLLGDGNWDYVPNKSGGFMGFGWHVKQGDNFGIWLQLEEKKLCFKIGVNDKSKQVFLRDHLRDKWFRAVIKESRNLSLDIIKPAHFGTGTSITVAMLNTDYRQVDDEGRIDMEKTITLLKKAEELLDAALLSQTVPN